MSIDILDIAILIIASIPTFHLYVSTFLNAIQAAQMNSTDKLSLLSLVLLAPFAQSWGLYAYTRNAITPTAIAHFLSFFTTLLSLVIYATHAPTSRRGSTAILGTIATFLFEGTLLAFAPSLTHYSVEMSGLTDHQLLRYIAAVISLVRTTIRVHTVLDIIRAKSGKIPSALVLAISIVSSLTHLHRAAPGDTIAIRKFRRLHPHHLRLRQVFSYTKAE